jgi:Na+-transporting NADH:ubiquinone oxidoreductase subunit NqrC
MKKIVVIVLMLAVVAGILAASAAYLFQNKKMQELERQVAQAEELYNAKDYDGTL